MDILKIATWNIGGAHTINSNRLFDYNKEDLNYFAKQLEPLNLDIVCLQESHTNSVDVLSERLAKMLDMKFVFDSPRSPSHIDSKYQLSNAIISRHPINNIQHIPLPDPTFELYLPDGSKAQLFKTYIEIANIKNIFIANTHLQPLHVFGYKWDTGEGQKLALKTEDAFLNSLKTPLILAGDLNIPDLKKSLPKFMQSFNLKSALNNQPTNVRGQRVDYILYSPEIKPIKSNLIKTDNSDHYLSYMEFKINK